MQFEGDVMGSAPQSLSGTQDSFKQDSMLPLSSKCPISQWSWGKRVDGCLGACEPSWEVTYIMPVFMPFNRSSHMAPLRCMGLGNMVQCIGPEREGTGSLWELALCPSQGYFWEWSRGPCPFYGVYTIHLKTMSLSSGSDCLPRRAPCYVLHESPV